MNNIKKKDITLAEVEITGWDAGFAIQRVQGMSVAAPEPAAAPGPVVDHGACDFLSLLATEKPSSSGKPRRTQKVSEPRTSKPSHDGVPASHVSNVECLHPKSLLSFCLKNKTIECIWNLKHFKVSGPSCRGVQCCIRPHAQGVPAYRGRAFER